MVEHKWVGVGAGVAGKGHCLKINGKQTVKLRSGLFKFKNHFKQLTLHVTFHNLRGYDSHLMIGKFDVKVNVIYKMD